MAYRNYNGRTPVGSYRYKTTSLRTPIIIASGSLVLIAALVGVILYQVVHNNKIEEAKNQIKQFDKQHRNLVSYVSPLDDSDQDGINNEKEEVLGTDYLCGDSDADGLTDGDELTLDTDPLKTDTDGDGIKDGVEIISNLNPKLTQTNNSGDAAARFTVKKTLDELTAEIIGSAEMNATVLDTLNVIGFSANSGIVTSAYEIYNDVSFDSCKLTFSVGDNYIGKKLSVFKFNAEDSSFEAIPSETDKKAKTVTAEIFKYGTYVVGVTETISEEADTRIHFLIDNSGSMYPQDIVPDSPENDVYFKRLDFAENLIEKFDESYSVAISKFTQDYTCIQNFTNDKRHMQAALDSIRNGDENFNGTYIQSSLEKCIASFKDTDKKTVNIIIMITDGDTTEEKAPDVSRLQKLAEQKNVIILTVSIGTEIDKSVLTSIANRTNGMYFSAHDAKSLTDVHNRIITSLDYSKVELEQTDKTDAKIGYMLYDSGFSPADDGFGFKDFRTTATDSVSFGLAVFARDWYTKEIAWKLDGVLADEGSVYKYNADGYDLTGSDFENSFENNKNLRDMSFIAVAVSRFTDPSKYLEFKKSKDGILKIDEDIRYEAVSKGWAEKKYSLDKKIYGCDSVNMLVFDIEGKYPPMQSAYGDDEAMFYKAVYRLNAEFYNSQSSAYSLSAGDKTFDMLCTSLSEGVPAVMLVNGNKAVNAISLAKNAAKPSEYIMKIYDSSQPDIAKEIIITKTVGCSVDDNGKIIAVRNFYNAQLDGKPVSLSLCDVKF